MKMRGMDREKEHPDHAKKMKRDKMLMDKMNSGKMTMMGAVGKTMIPNGPDGKMRGM